MINFLASWAMLVYVSAIALLAALTIAFGWW
jgi:hypothetical protein